MKYQMALQFTGNSLSYDGLISLEDLLIENLEEDRADIDGHDFGNNESNIFIFTDDPKGVFEEIKTLIDRKISEIMKVGYREVDSEEYTVLYPSGVVDFSIK